MVLWHLAAVLWLFRWVFRDPKVDIRFLLAGALIPDLVDLTVGTLLFPDRFSSGELFFHSLTVVTAYGLFVLLGTRRGRRRRAFMALAVGWMLHLLIDGLWTTPEVLFWPFFGWDLPGGLAPYWPEAWQRALADPWRWVLEGAGALYLAALWRRLRLGEDERRRVLISTGRLPEVTTDEA